MSSSSAGKSKGLTSILVLLMVSQMQASEGRHMNLTDWSSSHDNEGKMPSSPPTDNTTYLLNNITSQLNDTSTVAVNSSGQQPDVSPDDNVGLDVTVQPTLTDGTNVTDQALSKRSHETAPDLTDPCKKDNDNCTGRCGSWEDTHTCQCDASCQTFGDCCDGYEEVCRHQESASLANETTRDRAINADSCQWRCNDDVRTHGALCFCNASCLEMGNCCEDYQDTCVRKYPTTETVRQLREEEPLQCMTIEPPNQYNLSESYWMVANCPTSFPRNEARLLCEEKHSLEEDPLLHLPVLSTTSSGHKSYKNVFCSVCNNASSVIAWTAVVSCRGLEPELKKAVKNDECFLKFKAPKGRARKCFPATSLSFTCEHAEKCSKGIPSPIIVVRKPYRSFRNIFCAKCTLEDLVYREVFCGAEIQGMSVFFTSLSATIDYSEISKTVVTGKFMFRSRKETFACPQGHLYDPFLETCRKVDHFPSNRLPADMRKKEGGNRESQRLSVMTSTPSPPCPAGTESCKGEEVTTPKRVIMKAWGNFLPLPERGVFVYGRTEDPPVVTASSVTADAWQPTFPTSTARSDTATSPFDSVSTSYHDQTSMENGLLASTSDNKGKMPSSPPTGNTTYLLNNITSQLNDTSTVAVNSSGQQPDVSSDDSAGLGVTVQPTLTDDTNVTDQALSERSSGDETASDLTDPCEKDNDNCTGRCGSWEDTHTCQCDASCQTFGDCCDDYGEVCRHHESAFLTNETTRDRAINADSCQWRCNDDARAHRALCFCNASCLDMGNCCEDYQDTCVRKDPTIETVRQFREEEPLQCMTVEPPNQYNLSKSYWMVATCPTSFPSNEARLLCEEKRSFEEDPLLHLPVLSTTSSGHKSYKNVFCAVCNNASSMIAWKAVTNCRGLEPELKKAVKNDRCSLVFKAPKGRARKCFPATSLSSTCEHAEKCDKGIISPIVVLRKPYRTFRNIFCAKCALEDLVYREVLCSADLATRQVFTSLSVIIDYSEISKTVVTEHFVFWSRKETFYCPQGHLYDPFLETCRKVVLSNRLPVDTRKQEGGNRESQRLPVMTSTPSPPCPAGTESCKGEEVTTPKQVIMKAWGNFLPLPEQGVFDYGRTENPPVVTASSVTADAWQPDFPTSTARSDIATSPFNPVSTSYHDRMSMENGLLASTSDNKGKMPSSPTTGNTTYLLNNITGQLNDTSKVAVNSSGQQPDVSPDDNVGLEVTVQPTLTDGTNVTDQALSERSPGDEIASDLTDPCEKDNDNCTGRCGSWRNTHTCQCDASCQTFGDCCDDYEEVCKHQESASLKNETTRDRAINAASCQWRCNDELRPHGALCFCNASCLDMGNCCEDYQDTCVRKDPTTETVRQLREDEPLQCMAVEPRNKSYWMVASCPTSFPSNEARLLCEEKHSFEEDPLLHLPVLSTTSSGHKSFKNVFCAVCNNASSMIAWTAVANCRGFVTKLKEALKNDRCSLEFEAPEGQTRKCFPATPLSPTCNHAEKCRKGVPSPIVVTRKPSRSFRNIFCAKCTLEDLVYQEVFCGAEIRTVSQFFTSLSVTIDYSEISKTVVTENFMFQSRKETFSCPQGDLYDPFVETCRKLDHVPYNRLPVDMRKQEEGNRESQRPPVPVMTSTPSPPCPAGTESCKGEEVTTPKQVIMKAWGNFLPLPERGVFVYGRTEDPPVVTASWAKSSSVTADAWQPHLPTSTARSDTATSPFNPVRTSYYEQTSMENGLLASTSVPTAEETSCNVKESTFDIMHSSSYAMVAIFLFFMATRKCGRHLPRNLLETNLILALAINQTGHFLVKSVPDLAASKVVAVGSLHLMLVCELCTSAVIRHLDALARNGANTSRSAAGEVGYILACWFCPGALVLLNLGNGIRYTVVGGCCWLYQTSPPVWAVFAMMPAIKLYHFLRLIITCARHMGRSVIPLLVEATCLFSVSALVSSLMVVASLLPTPLALSALSAVFATSAGMAAVVVVACRLVDSSISALASDLASPYASTELPDTNSDGNTNIVLLSVRHLDDING
ncbi:hypothetical protein Bbelb_294420 [Branchiostoma belcheri]|nr:hypothetical protein Bbelb_294420 [Branchiostoma belcheri]